MNEKIEGWTLGLNARNRKYFHYYVNNQWLCGTTKIAIPSESAFKLGLCSIHDEIDESIECKKCRKILDEK